MKCGDSAFITGALEQLCYLPFALDGPIGSWQINSESHMSAKEAMDINFPQKRKCFRITNCTLNLFIRAGQRKCMKTSAFSIHLSKPLTYWKNSSGDKASRSFYKGKSILYTELFSPNLKL